MAALESARLHLDEALARLEHALANRLRHLEPDQGSAVAQLSEERNALARDVHSLREQCDRLHAELQASQQNHEQLRELTDGVAERLDDSIAELNHLLAE